MLCQKINLPLLGIFAFIKKCAVLVIQRLYATVRACVCPLLGAQNSADNLSLVLQTVVVAENS